MKFTGCIREPEKLTASFPALKLPLSGGYEEGYADGRTDGYTAGEQAARAEAVAHNAAILTDCNAVLPDKGVEPADTLEQVPQRIGEIKAEPNWTRRFKSLREAFNGIVFPENSELVFNCPDLINIQYAFRNARNVKSIKFVGGSDRKNVGTDYAFNACRELERLDISEMNSNLVGLFESFNDCYKLREIIGEIEFDKPRGFHFYGCGALEEIRFKAGTIGGTAQFNWSPNLSAESIQSIIDGLADLTGATAQTLTFHKNVGAKLTQAQKDAVSAKNWTLVY